jgi:tRNA1Val (adenine37-N6)-methyltransferase
VGKSGNRIVVFKQFSVRDDRCAMKVGTDALLLGSWSNVENAEWIADIGTGSGIVALMAAQRAPSAQVVGVELEPNANVQAQENFASSPFAERMKAVHASAQEFAADPAVHGRFDVVLSNPPFFKDKPKSPHPERNLARHDESLPIAELLGVARKLLKDGGLLQLVWPLERREELEDAASSTGFSLTRVTEVSGSIHRHPNRLLMSWVKGDQHDFHVGQQARMNAIHIEEGFRKDGKPLLSSSYIQLLRPYRDL